MNIKILEIAYLLENEFKIRFDKHKVNKRLRIVLINWMAEIMLWLVLKPEVFVLSVKLLDLYLSKRKIENNHLQLLGFVCLVIANKIESHKIIINKLMKVCEYPHHLREILAMERMVCDHLEWKLWPLTPFNFLGVFETYTDILETYRYLIEYLCCLSMYTLNSYLPSIIAATAVFVARHTLKFAPVWKSDNNAIYTINDIIEPAKKLNEAFRDEHFYSPRRPLFKKYSSALYYNVGEFEYIEII